MVGKWFYFENKEDLVKTPELNLSYHPYRVLVLSRNYPNNVLTQLGLWVKGLVQHCEPMCELKVISPVPYCPPIAGFPEYSRFRQVVRRDCENGVEVLHPRFFVGPGRYLYNLEALAYGLGIRRQVNILRKNFDFNLIHAHFAYPDGVVAVWLGRRFHKPVVITEHAPWRPNWMDRSNVVRRQAVWAAKQSVFQIAVSRSVRDTMIHFTKEPEKIRIIPIGVDGSTFTALHNDGKYNPNQILYVGFINFNKGFDVLLNAMRRLTVRRPEMKLIVVGGSFYQNTLQQEQRLRRLVQELGLSRCVEFHGIKPPVEVRRYMQESALLVLPSRAESFGAVLVEALACGTPVVATRCGGPEDIVDDKVGVLVPKENEEALAMAMDNVLTRRDQFDATRLRAYALENFSWEHIAHRTVALYAETLDRFNRSHTRSLKSEADS